MTKGDGLLRPVDSEDITEGGIVANRLSRDYGYTAGGYDITSETAVTEKYDDVANTWTAKDNLNTARYSSAGFSLNGYGYTAGGCVAASSAVTEKYNDVTNTWTAKANLNTARKAHTGFSLNGYGYVAAGFGLNDTDKYDDVVNTWTLKSSQTQDHGTGGFSLNGYGYTASGSPSIVSTEKYDDVADTWTLKGNLNTARGVPAGFSLNGYGYTAGGTTGASSAVTEKYNDVTDIWTAKTNMNTARECLVGFSLNGYGYTAAGWGAAASDVVEKYDDVADTWTTKTNLNTARDSPAGFALGAIHDGVQNPEIIPVLRIVRNAENPRVAENAIKSNRLSRDYGYVAGGNTGSIVAVTEKHDDVANTWTAKTNLNTAREYLAGFSLNGYGYTAGGNPGAVSTVTEKYDDVADTWTAKANLNTARGGLADFGLNGYGYTAGGCVGPVANAVTEKYNDVADTWTAKANLNTAREYLAGFSLNGYGYTAGGDTGVNSTVTEKYDDVADTWTAKTDLNTARTVIAGFSLNGYGYTAGGYTAAASAVTEKYNDVADTWTTKTNLNTARDGPSGFDLNGYGYTAGGYGTAAVSAVTEQYDDVADAWTAKANLNTARSYLAGFALGAIHAGVHNPEIIPILHKIRNMETLCYGEAYIYNNAVDTVIETINTPIALRQISSGLTNNFTFDAGSTDTITVYADYSGTVAGTVLVTSAGHGLSTGDIITIRGAANYKGVFEITYVGVNTFYITHTWDGDDGASDWDQGASLTANSIASGLHKLAWTMCTEPSAACSLVWIIYINTTPCTKCTDEHKYPINTIRSVSSSALVEISDGDIVWLSVESDDTANILNKHGNFSIRRV